MSRSTTKIAGMLSTETRPDRAQPSKSPEASAEYLDGWSSLWWNLCSGW